MRCSIDGMTASGGHRAIDDLGAMQLVGQRPGGIGGAGGHGAQPESGPLLLEPGEQLLGFAQVHEHAHRRLAAGTAEGLDEAPIGLAMRGIALEKCHIPSIQTTGSKPQRY